MPGLRRLSPGHTKPQTSKVTHYPRTGTRSLRRASRSAAALLTWSSRLGVLPKPRRMSEPRIESMEDRNRRCSRRKFLAQAAALSLGGGLPHRAIAKVGETPEAFRARPPRPSKEGRKPIAVVCTVYRPLSHADHIA